MKRYLIVIGLILMLGLAGCYSPDGTTPVVTIPAVDANSAPTATVLTIIAPPVTSIPEGIATEIPPTLNISTAEPIIGATNPAIINTPNVALPSNVSENGCQIPGGWQAYTLAQGDTLFGLSIELETTIDEIAAGNCLDDPNNLTAGEVIYLPQAGAAPVSTANQAAPQAGSIGAMLIDVTPATSASNVRVLPVGSVQFTVSNYAPETAQIEFFLLPSGINNAPQRIGTDTNLSDGASLSFTVNENLFGDVYASALDANGDEIERTDTLRVVADG